MQPGGQGGGHAGVNNINPGGGQPHATEYTLQGVMRFLQTEWHRHERDRNAWEIDKQEMKGRIANLEGAARRADATQKALKKYVAILEAKVKEQSAQLKAAAAGDNVGDEATKPKKLDREALIQAKLRCKSAAFIIPGLRIIRSGFSDVAVCSRYRESPRRIQRHGGRSRPSRR